MNIEVSEVIDRSPEVVFQFVGVEHIRNHPRWDTKMELEQLSDGPMAVGTRVRRRHTRAGYPIDGMMECVEFDHQGRSGGRSMRDRSICTVA
jgi:hypothetical protein